MAVEHYVYVLHARSLVHTGEDVVLVEAIGEDSLTLLECEAPAEAEFHPGERIPVGNAEPTRIDHVRQRLIYGELSLVARDALETAVTALVRINEERFVDLFNSAESVSLQRHKLDLLPTVGEARRNRILRERDRQPFDTFADLADRIQGLPDPAALVAQRIVTELSIGAVTHRLFIE